MKHLLTSAKFTGITQKGGSFKCKDKRCKTCKHIIESNEINITSTNEKFKILSPMNCKSQHVLYIITCVNCQKQYVGQTHTSLNLRVNTHRSQLKNEQYRVLPVTHHLAECNKNNDLKFTIVPFYKCTDDKALTDAKETYFIKRFQTKLNH